MIRKFLPLLLLLWALPAWATNSISGNAGLANALVSYTGTAAGNVTADGSGNYTISGLSNGSYTVSPSFTAYAFSPINQVETISGSNITGVNFTATALPLHVISDNFARADGALGANWGTVIPNNAENGPVTSAGGILINSQGYGAINLHGGDAASLWQGANVNQFSNDQWAVAQVKTVAAPTAVLAISAAVQTGGNTTYTYTVSSGSVATAIAAGSLYVVITGMAHAGNNGHFTATTFGAGTFTVANASGVTATESGTGTCPSDSGAGVMVRGSGTSAATLNGYFYHVGSNSFSGDGRVAYHELWKIINGVGTLLYATGNADTTLLPASEFLAITAVGSKITAYKNGVVLQSVTDTSITSGNPGVTSWSANGPNEYIWANWPTDPTMTGNNGTTLNAYQAGDTTAIINQLATENFTETGTFGMVDLVPYSNGDLHTANANWVYEGSSTFTVTSNTVYGNHSGNNLAYRSDVSAPTNDQFAEEKVVETASSATQNHGPAVRVSSSATTAYYVQCANNLLSLAKNVAGTQTVLNTSGSSCSTGDAIRITVVGTTLNYYKNGVLVGGPITDSSISSGNVGIFNAGNSSSNGFTQWTGGSITELTAATNFINGTGNGLMDPTAGAYPGNPDPSGHTQIYENTISWPNNQYAQATSTSATHPLAGTVGPSVRTTAGVNGYYCGPDNTGTHVNINRMDSGVFTQLGTDASYTYTQNDVFTLKAEGPTLICIVNGTVAVTAVDTTYASGRPGLIWAGGGVGLTAKSTFGTWSGGEVGGYAISGSAGTAGATVSWTGTSSGSVTADGSGNYSITGLANGSYTVTPSKTGFTFSPVNSAQTISNASNSGVNFTASQNCPCQIGVFFVGP